MYTLLQHHHTMMRLLWYIITAAYPAWDLHINIRITYNSQDGSRNSTFTKKVIKTQHNYKHWITTGIKTSCKRKRELLFLRRLSNDYKRL
jgi:hypothetical protein